MFKATLHKIIILCNISTVFAAESNAPTNCNITINDNAAYTNTRYITLDLYGTDESAMQVWISNDGNTGTIVDYSAGKTINITDTNYTVGTTFSSSNSTTSTNSNNVLRIQNWPLDEPEGTKNVYVVFRDAYGNKTELSELITITITYNLNGKSGTTPPASTTVKNLGVYLPTTTVSGYKFMGWSTSKTANVASYSPGTMYVGNANTTLYAVCNPIITGNVSISGTLTYGQQLTANVNNLWPSDSSLKYQWYYNSSASTSGGTAISNATSNTYTIGSGLAGKYIYVVVTASGTNYVESSFTDIADSTNNESATIRKISLTKPTASTTSYNYTGSTITLGVSGYYSSTMNISGNTGTNANSYTATISLKDSNNYQWADDSTGNVTIDWKINKIANTASITGKTNLSYTGSAQALVSTASAQGAVYYAVGTQLTASNYSSAGSTTIPTRTDAGTYTVYYYVVGNTNYNAKSGNVSVSIAKVTPTVNLSATSDSVNYNSSKTFTVTSSVAGKMTVTSGATNVSITGGNGASLTANTASTVTYKGATGKTTATTITIVVTPTNSNYNSVTKTYSVTSVNKIANTLTVTGKTGLKQSSSAQALVTVANAQGTVYYSVGTQLTASNYTSGSTTIPTRTAAGTYTVYYYTPGNTNYNAKSGSVSTKIATAAKVETAKYTHYWFEAFYNVTTTNTSLTYNCYTWGGFEKLNIPITNLTVGQSYTLSFTHYTSASSFLSGNKYGCKVSSSEVTHDGSGISGLTWTMSSPGTKTGSLTFTATATTMWWNWDLCILPNNSYTSGSITNISITAN